jgi:cytochrome P450
MALRQIHEALGSPPVYLIDLRPVNYPTLIVASHEAAEQVSKTSKLFPYSTPKSPTVKSLVSLIGEHSILSSDAEHWKAIRKRYNPGFAPQHLITLLPCILDKTWHFLRILDSYARSGEEFRLEKLVVNLTFDIIGKHGSRPHSPRARARRLLTRS